MTSTTKYPRISYGEMRTNLEKVADESIKENVLRGIEFLNEKYGPDWVDHIDPRTLILSNGTHCVLGQLYDPKKTEAGAEMLERLVGDLQLNFHDDSDSGYYLAESYFSNTDGDNWDEKELGFVQADYSYVALTNGWRVALGYPEVDREPKLP